ncbi:MAG: hypothetical protein NTW87_21305 [Planctomycetota bacterium]|nr:hypothetical protein [Planctomycetota bacterium]
MTDTRDIPPDSCDRVTAIHVKMLAGEELDAQERDLLAAHVAACTACRALQGELAEVDQALRTALATPRSTPGFVARTMSALPPAGATPRIFAAAPRPRWSWARTGIAAALVVGVLVAWLGMSGKLRSGHGSMAVVSVMKGHVTDSAGRPVQRLKMGEVYKVTETALLPLASSGMLKVQAGTEFQLRRAEDSNNPELKLQAGDLYARGQDDHNPMRVAGSGFEALLRKGDFFVADEGEDTPASVVIVFAGQAQVSVEEETMPVSAGQVFFSAGRDVWDVASAADLAAVMPPAPDGVAAEELALLRREYHDLVVGYQRELKVLEQMATQEQNKQQLAELRERQQRVTTYRDAHKRRLESLGQALIFEIIRRGLEGYTSDPAAWM